ncbi:MAG: dihydropteroate synthase [Alphaproteobacteria bacterium]|nr:dihydropteroate synthase [Alphaproteobacteria bacterium]
MTNKTYHRPAGLVFGPDAEALIKEGRGGSLGGLSAVSYTLVEVIERDGERIDRRFEPYTRERALPLPATVPAQRPLVMGIVNVTPDSFSDGGKNAETETAVASGIRMAKEGADILDVGGESTRPGSEGISEDQELARIIPVIEGLVQEGLKVSCDTRKARVMDEALKAGASIINDVSALTHDPHAIPLLVKADCPVVLMHAQGDPRTMQLNPTYDDVALDVFDALEARIAAAVSGGIALNRLIADPGIGFGKTFRHNVDLLNQFTLFHGLGVPLLMGLSRKGFIGALTGEKVAGNRVYGSVGGALWSALNGAQILRVHDVKATVEALAVAWAAADPEESGL